MQQALTHIPPLAFEHVFISYSLDIGKGRKLGKFGSALWLDWVIDMTFTTQPSLPLLTP